jgi:hypothetical protein
MTVEETIHKHFAEQATIDFNALRFGLKSCKVDKDVLYMQDILEIYNTAKELDDCDGELGGCSGCSLNTVEEIIKTL